MSSKLSPRQKQKLFRYAQYAILAVIALAAILLADWKTLSQQVFNLDVAAKQFPDVITVALKNTLLYTALGFVVGLSGGLLLALMRISSIAPYRWIATLYVELFRGIPALLVFFAFGYGIPLAFKIRFVDNPVSYTHLDVYKRQAENTPIPASSSKPEFAKPTTAPEPRCV